MVSLCFTISAQEQKVKENSSNEHHTSHENHSNHMHHNLTDEWYSDRPDGHAPISIMGDHMHHKGGWMFTYRFMNMNMQDLQQDRNDITNMQAHMEGYMATPLEMSMNMHMLGVMYAPSNNITLMMMANYISNDMSLQMLNMSTDMIMPFSTTSSGFGDLKILGLFKIFNKNKQAMHAKAGISIPTGSIENKDVTPMSMSNQMILPYPMQTGSGTIDTELGITYLGQQKLLSWGSQLIGVLRFGANDYEYRMGNTIQFNNWLAIKTTNWLSFSGRIEAVYIDNIHGANPDLNPAMVTTANTNNSGGNYFNFGLGFNTYVPKGQMKDFRFSFEFEAPISQSLNGIQLEYQNSFMLGVQYAFH